MADLVFRHKLEGVLTDLTSVKLANREGTYGLKRVDTGEILVASGTAFTRSSLGVYTFSFPDPSPLPLYDYWVEVTFDNEIDYLHRVQHVGDVVQPNPPPDDGEPTTGDCTLLPCGTVSCNQSSWVFARLRVEPTIRQGTTVEWLLDPRFADAGPYVFQLQVGHTGSNLSDDWENVGLPAENASYLIDAMQRVFGQTQWTHYRVVLTTPDAVYISIPQATWGDLPPAAWRIYLATEQEYRLQLQRTHRGQDGWLLKRRLAGEAPDPSHDILDPETDEIVRPQAAETVGTEFVGGYYAPIPCIFAELMPLSRREQIDGSGSRGTINDDQVVSARLLARPQLDSYDVWVSRKTGFRWAIHKIKHEAEINGVPVTVTAEFRKLPFSDPVYAIAMEE